MLVVAILAAALKAVMKLALAFAKRYGAVCNRPRSVIH
jgi:hypothetical protein